MKRWAAAPRLRKQGFSLTRQRVADILVNTLQYKESTHIMPKIHVTRIIPDRGIEILTEAFGAESITVGPEGMVDRADLLGAVKDVDAILSILTEDMDAELMDAAGPQLQIIANMAVGYNNIDVAAATERGIPVTNTPGVLTESTADLTFALMLAAARRLGEAERFLRASKWAGWGPTLLMGLDVHGKTLGIFGMGRIGQAVARRARAFNMPILYFDPANPEVPPELEARQVDLPMLLAESDILSIHCLLTPETTKAFGAAEFKAMKKRAIIVNAARGPVIDEEALAHALETGEIYAAGLDVFEDEPKIHPGLLDCQNAVLLPHVGSATEETRGKMAEIAANNIVARLNGETPPNCLNPEVL